MVALQKQRYMTPEEYLKREREAETKSEYHDGKIIAMAGASWEHNLITSNLTRRIGNQLDNDTCIVVSSDLRVRVAECNRYYYPDVVVVCGDPQFDASDTDTLVNPTLIIEVLSPSTERTDREEKFDCYGILTSITTYVLVTQDRPRIECFTRQPDGSWRYDVAKGLDAVLPLEMIGCDLSLTEIYNRVKFPAIPSAETQERVESN